MPDDVPLATAKPAVTSRKPKVHLEINDDEEDFAPYPPKGQQNGQFPPYSFFPVNFGRTAGGAIAVANAFSTGKGAARSHAIAYGSSPSKRNAGKHVDVE